MSRTLRLTKLEDELEIDRLQRPAEETEAAVRHALKVGYRHVSNPHILGPTEKYNFDSLSSILY